MKDVTEYFGGLKPVQDPLDYLAGLEKTIAKHAENCRNSKYHIYRDGYFYTATNSEAELNSIVRDWSKLYTYTVNKNYIG